MSDGAFQFRGDLQIGIILMIQEALSYRDKSTQSAKGETARFLALFSEYRKVPVITRKRLYLEFARECLSQLKNIYLIDQKDGVSPVDLHLLPGT